MSNTKKGLRALSLSFLAVLGFMAFAAAGAQGQEVGKFLDAGGELAVGTTFTGAQEGKGSLLVAKLNMAIECETADVEEGVVTAKLVAEVAGIAHATIKFLNCIVKTAALVTLGACEVNGKSVLAKVKLLAMKSGAGHGTPFVLAEPLTAGQPFATIKIIPAPWKFCSLSGTYDAKGTLALKVLTGNVNPQLVIAYANQKLLGNDELLLGTNPAVMDPSATIETTGPAGLVKVAFGVC